MRVYVLLENRLTTIKWLASELAAFQPMQQDYESYAT